MAMLLKSHHRWKGFQDIPPKLLAEPEGELWRVLGAGLWKKVQLYVSPDAQLKCSHGIVDAAVAIRNNRLSQF